MARVHLIEALNQGMARALAEDPRVVVLGEDVGVSGGVFRATGGLQERFGEERVQDTPLAEGMLAGMAIGMAAQGLRPLVEIQFEGFLYPALDQLVSHAARLRHRTRGRLSCPLVIRCPIGGGIRAPEHHSDSPEAMFAHIPGLRVVIPSSPQRAYGLLLAAVRDPDPVLFFEPKRIYRGVREEVADDGEARALDRCFVLREGTDITLVTWGALTREALQAAEALAEEGIDCEVIDPATLSPLDIDTIVGSVERTGRLAIAHEAPYSFGVGAEIAARVAEQALYSLQAPIRRITGYDTIMPLHRLESDYLPDRARIVDAVRASMEE